jgi:hypothetical protein
MVGGRIGNNLTMEQFSNLRNKNRRGSHETGFLPGRHCCLGETLVLCKGAPKPPDEHVKAQNFTIVKWAIGLYT